MKRKSLSLLALTIFLTACDIFPRDVKLIMSLESPNRIPIKVYFVQLGATTNDALNIFSYNTNGDSICIGAYEHNWVKSAKFFSKDSVEFTLSDTSIYGVSKKTEIVMLNIHKAKENL